MIMMEKLSRLGSIGVMALAVGCSGAEAPEVSSGNAALGIAKFEIKDTRGQDQRHRSRCQRGRRSPASTSSTVRSR